MKQDISCHHGPSHVRHNRFSVLYQSAAYLRRGEPQYHLSLRRQAGSAPAWKNSSMSKAKKYRGKNAALVTNHSGYDFDLRQNIQLLRERGINVSMVLAPEHGVYGYKNDIDYQAVVVRPARSTVRSTTSTASTATTLQYLLQQVGRRHLRHPGHGDALLHLHHEPEGHHGRDGRPGPGAHRAGPAQPRGLPRHGRLLPGKTLHHEVRQRLPRSLPLRHDHRRSGALLPGRIPARGEADRGPHERVLPERCSSSNTNLPWIPPSPNLPTYESAIVYTAIVLMEGINLSLGRGTTKPFEYIGAPWIEPVAFCEMLNDLELKNFRFKPVYFNPFQQVRRACAAAARRSSTPAGNSAPPRRPTASSARS